MIPLICRGILSLRVPCQPELAVFFAQRRLKFDPGILSDRLGLFDPRQKQSAFTLDARDVAIKPSEGVTDATRLRANVSFANVEVRLQPRRLSNGRLDLFKRAIIQRVP